MNKYQMLGNLKAMSLKAPFRINTMIGVHAIATSQEVRDAELLWESKVAEGIVPGSLGTVLICKPTFTFAGPDIRRTRHTCTEHEMMLVFGRILNRMYKETHAWDMANSMDAKILLDARKILCEQDRRIYVPMATERFELIWLEFGKTTLAQAEDHLTEHMESLGLIK